MRKRDWRWVVVLDCPAQPELDLEAETIKCHRAPWVTRRVAEMLHEIYEQNTRIIEWAEWKSL